MNKESNIIKIKGVCDDVEIVPYMSNLELYRCDPDKNKTCKKTNCYRICPKYGCKSTTNKKYKMSKFKQMREDKIMYEIVLLNQERYEIY